MADVIATNAIHAAIAASADGRYQLDYPPGRLLLIAVWVWASSIAEQVPPE